MTEESPKRQPQAETPRPAASEPDPGVEAPALVSVSKGYDPRKPNPGRVGEPKQQPEAND